MKHTKAEKTNNLILDSDKQKFYIYFLFIKSTQNYDILNLINETSKNVLYYGVCGVTDLCANTQLRSGLDVFVFSVAVQWARLFKE